MQWNIWDFPKNLFVLIDEKTRNLFFNEMYQKFGSQRQYALFLKKDRTSIQGYHYARNWNNGNRYIKFIPLQVLHKSLPFMQKETKEKIEKSIIEIRTQGGKSIENPILPVVESPSFYRIVAHLIGDGNDSHTPYYANTCNELRVQFENDLQTLGKIDYSETNLEATPCVNFPKVVTRILRYILKVKFTYPNKIPERIFKASYECKSAFLQALFDDEGTISTNLAIGMSQLRIIKEIKKLLKYFAIETGIITPTNYLTKRGIKQKFAFNINKKSYLTFCKKINFSHPKKVIDLKSKIKTQTRKERTRPKHYFNEEILNILKIGPSGSLNIADKLELTLSGLRPHLDRLYQEGKIFKKGYKNKIIWHRFMV